MKSVFICLAALSASASAVNFGEVMFAGDSLTGGWEETGRGGYRGPLLDELRLNGHTATPVGQMTNDSWNLPIADRNHEGHNGWTSEQINVGLATWFANFTPDTVVLMTGTNNTPDWADPILTRQKVSNLFDTVFAYRSDVRLFVSNIPDANPNYASWWQYHQIHADNVHAAVLAEVAEHQALGRQAYFVDVRSVVDPVTEIRDTVHPTTQGFRDMAHEKFKVMNAVPEPAILSAVAIATILTMRRRRK